MSDIDLFSDSGSPFDAIRQIRADGTEFWSARDLMPLMGYARWENFETPIRRAMKTAENQGMDVATLFLRSQEKTAGRPREDFELARYAAYLVAMNGDPNIPKVAEAQHYFAVRTREAETAPQQPTFLIPKTYAGALRAAAEQAERAELAEQQNKMLEARIEKDAPLVAKAEAHSRADNAAVNRQTFAREVQAWGVKQGINILHEHVYHLLRKRGMLIDGDRSDRNHASSQAVKAGWAWTHKDVTPDGHATAVTYLRAHGQDVAWKWITTYVAEHGDLRPRAAVSA